MTPTSEAARTIYLVRHAIAARRGEKYPDDRRRPVTRRGAERMRLAARGFARMRPGVDLVLASPLVRARQTAEILVEALEPTPALDVLEALAPGHAPADIAAALGPFAVARGIALVGHEPGLGVLAAWLIGAREPLAFKKGGIACVETAVPPSRDGRLRWFAPPRLLRALAR